MHHAPFRRARDRALPIARLGAVAVAFVAVGSQAGVASAAITTPATAGGVTSALADGMPAGSVTGSSFSVAPASGNYAGTADAALSDFPTAGSTFGLLGSGNLALADTANTAADTTTDNGGGDGGHGTTFHDVVTLKVDLAVPSDRNCLSLDFKLLSEEFPEFVGSQFNDGVIAELDTSDFTANPDFSIAAPHNFAFDSLGNVVSINTTGFDAANSVGTTYDGGTPLLRAKTPITSGAHTLYISVFDQGDAAYDSAALLDALTLGHVDQSADCAAGAVPVNDHATTTAYTGSTTVQYSDPATLSGTLTDTTADPDAPVAGQQLGFTVGTQTASAGPTDASGNASTSLVVTQQPGSVSTVGTAFAGVPGFLASSDSDGFTITKEDCTLAYSGDLTVAPTASTTLAADLGELDSSVGDLSGKTATFTVTDASSAVTTYTATTNAAGHAATTVALPSGVYGVAVSFAGDGYYKPCGSSLDSIVTVQAAGAKVTGGGWTSVGTGRTNFGFNAIPQAGGTYKGQFQLRSAKNRFHGNVVTTLSGTATTATWSGTGSWNGAPNYKYTVSVADNGSSGAKKGDTITITIKSPANATVFSTGGAVAIKGGNITVH